MPRTNHTWTKEMMEDAMNVVRAGVFTAYEVALRYNIPRSTLMAHFERKYGRKSHSTANSMALPKEVEERLADNLKYMEKHGFTFTIKENLELIGDYVKACGVQSRFKSGCPGENWFMSFANRYGLTNPQAENEFALFKEYFTVLKSTIEEHDLKDAGKIWFIDETSFNFMREKITGTNNDKVKNATVLTACNAEGQKVPVFIVFQHDNKPLDLVSNDEACYAVSEDGCLSKSEFRDYFTKTFLRYLRNAPPILIAFNGHSTQIDIKLVEESRRANIIFLKIPNLLKEYSIFNSLKRKWETELLNLKGNDLMKLCDLIITGFKNHTADDIKDSFRKAGIYPYDDSVTEEKYSADFVRRWTEHELSLKEKADNESNLSLDIVTVNMFDEQLVKVETEVESNLLGYGEDNVNDTFINQDHFTENYSSVDYEELANVSMTEEIENS